MDTPKDGEIPQNNWISKKNRGGLMQPQQCFCLRIFNFSRTFYLFHGKTIDFHPNPIERLQKIIVEKYKLTAEHKIYAAHVFIKFRFFNRIKILNEGVKASEKMKN